MKIRRTSDPDISFAAADPVQLWAYGIAEFKIDTRNRKFLVTPVMRDKSEGPVIDATDMFEKFQREQR
jgi:hypothetical protein